MSCPDNIIHYNKYMGGVDRGDQLRGYYLCRTKSRKFYKYIFYFLFDVAITNAYILYKHFHSHPSKSLLFVKDFRLQLAKELIGSYCSRRVPGRSVELFVLFSCSTSPSRNALRQQRRGAGVGGVATAQIITARGLTLAGGAESARCGSAMMETLRLIVFSCGTRGYEHHYIYTLLLLSFFLLLYKATKVVFSQQTLEQNYS